MSLSVLLCGGQVQTSLYSSWVLWGQPCGPCLGVPAGALHQTLPFGAPCLACAHCPNILCTHALPGLSSLGSDPIPRAIPIPDPNSSLDLDCYLNFNPEPDPDLCPAGAPWPSWVQRREGRTGEWLLSPEKGGTAGSAPVVMEGGDIAFSDSSLLQGRAGELGEAGPSGEPGIPVSIQSPSLCT